MEMEIPRNSKAVRGVVVPTSLEDLKETPRLAAKVSINAIMVYMVEKFGATISMSSI